MKLLQSEELIFEHENGRFYSLEYLDAKKNIAIFEDIQSYQYAVVSNPSITNKKLQWDFSYGYYNDMEKAREKYVLKTVSLEEINRLVEIEYIKEQLPSLPSDQIKEIYSACDRAYLKDETGLDRYKIVESVTDGIRNNDINIDDINRASPWDILDSVCNENNYSLKKDDDDLAYEMEI